MLVRHSEHQTETEDDDSTDDSDDSSHLLVITHMFGTEVGRGVDGG